VAAPITGADPDVSDVLVELQEELREQAADGAIRASGIAADVTLTDPERGETTDARSSWSSTTSRAAPLDITSAGRSASASRRSCARAPRAAELAR
jgi:hypothetical protein